MVAEPGFYPCDFPDQPAAADSQAVFILVFGSQLICCADSHKFLWDLSELAPFEPEKLSRHFLGIYGERPCYSLEPDIPASLPGLFEIRSLRSLLGNIDDLHFDLAGRAVQITQWYISHRFCGRCGQKTQASSTDRSLVCEPCQQHFYPRLSPCIIVVVTKGEECLLARNAAWEDAYYSALAGFIEPGETVEAALHREVREEVGIEVGSLRYIGSQPWPFPGQLMLGFLAEYQSGDIVVDGVEIVDAQWWRHDELPQCPDTRSLSGRLIQQFVLRCGSE